MLSVSLIERTLETADHDRLLRDLADNGLVLPLPIRIALAQSDAAVLALALRRLVELTYGPTDLSRRLIDRLLHAQRPDGAFAGESDHQADPLVSAVVLAALSKAAADHPAVASPALKLALEHGYAALAQLQDCDGLFCAPADRTLADRARTTAFIFHLLTPVPGFRVAVRLLDVRDWFERRDGQLERATQQLWNLARIGLCEGHDLHSLAGLVEHRAHVADLYDDSFHAA